MKQGFLKVSAVSPKVKVADTSYNLLTLKEKMKEQAKAGVKVTVFPELCITGYSCGDLFWQEKLIEEAKNALLEIADFSKGLDGLFFVGLPLDVCGKLYNTCAAVSGGNILGIVPKTYIPNYNEFYEARYFASGKDLHASVMLGQSKVPVDAGLIFECKEMPKLKLGVEICEDLWTPNPPSINLAIGGATLIVNPSASDEVTGKAGYRRDLVKGQSARLICGYIYASAGEGESTQDVVYSGHSLIAENGSILAESKRFASDTVISEIDVDRLAYDRRRMTTFEAVPKETVLFDLKVDKTYLTRYIDRAPFVPSDEEHRNARCEEILTIQAMGLKQRLEHIGCKTAVVGISGGLDSTLALLVTVKAFDMLKLNRKGIIAVTMPGFGTTDRTYDNAVNLIRCLMCTFKEVDIKGAVRVHFKDIEQDPKVHDVTYENSQARERTQILMDIANKENGIVIGTGDLSELALGWATYNGDHMSMYAVNVSVPKTLVRHLVKFYADNCDDALLSKTLLDVLDTPVSPELLPPENGRISQKTEDLVGPYELHDFFLYNMLRFGYSPKKIYRLALAAFKDSYDKATILNWLKTFYSRFFAQQFKRSCLPDGPKVGSVSVSPRGDLRMPSDASKKIWLDELNEIVV